ncbi:hypothetical protein KDL01_22195 [Actinospica durhamensis]|uniref:Uncharacterized protein n=1 Tax=Actinospica durhamensis TaxID=1508375 RepID=A0A941ERU6_9ACTN|nr:hypothetical protein [Actinospica durhamensis]MBR7836003.1 hypothetical protein [Actinospica durhamensis]
MDPLTFLLPGTQSLVSTILAEGWTQTRAALARKWSKKGTISQDAAEQELERGHELSLEVAGGDEADTDGRRALLEAYWTGYLAGLSAGHADLLDAIRELGAAREAGDSTPAPSRGSEGVPLLPWLGSSRLMVSQAAV